MNPALSFSNKLITWYHQNSRILPWRNTKEVYKIWLSEVILQQTRVDQGIPYYNRFVDHFPTVGALATASEKEVLRLWQGLGYYSRARNLHACAKIVHTEYKGIFPGTCRQLLTLPGIGSYTAAAVSSFAFDQPEAVVDGNVYRVLSRIFGIYTDITSQAGKNEFSKKAQTLLNVNCPGEYNQAIMEFGALCCTPKKPHCKSCVFEDNCFAAARGAQPLLPYKGKKVISRNRYFTYFVVQKGNKIALCKRQEKDIWNGLYDFYLVESSRIIKPDRLIAKDLFLQQIEKNSIAREESKIIKHILSHQRLSVRFIHFLLPSHFKEKGILKNKKLIFYSKSALASLPKSALIMRYLVENGMLVVQKDR